MARASEVAAALEKVATAVAEATAVVADLNTVLIQDRQRSTENSWISRAVDGNAHSAASSYVDFEPGLGFADWRCEILSLAEAK